MMNRLRLFMAGRYGLDRLGIGLIFISMMINTLARFSGIIALRVIAAAALIYALVRILSRRPVKRREQNYRFTRLWDITKTGVSEMLERRRQSDAYKFFVCPGCENRLRVPRGKGRVQITCPRCGQRFSKKT